MVIMTKIGLAAAPTFALKILIKIGLCQNVPFSGMNNLYLLNFSQKAIQGLPDSQDGQVGAGHGSNVGPEGPDQDQIMSECPL